MLPSLHFTCASITAKPLRERTAGKERVRKVNRKKGGGGGEEEEVGERRRDGREEEEAFRPIRMQRCSPYWHRSEQTKLTLLPAPDQRCNQKGNRLRFKKRPLVDGDNYRAGLDKRSRTAGGEAQNNPSQQATNWEHSRRPLSNFPPFFFFPCNIYRRL